MEQAKGKKEPVDWGKQPVRDAAIEGARQRQGEIRTLMQQLSNYNTKVLVQAH